MGRGWSLAVRSTIQRPQELKQGAFILACLRRSRAGRRAERAGDWSSIVMKFAKKLRSQIEAMPEWNDRFLSYKRLKQLLKANAGADVFLNTLIGEVIKINGFYCDQEEDFVILLKELGREAELSLASGNTHQQLLVCRALVLLHGQMVLLTNYSFLNFTGLVKIVKKHDKHANRSQALLRPDLIKWIHRQPFCRTEIISKLIYECERHLSLLRVEQLTGHARQDEKMEIVRRSTWVALQTIHHLKSHSSTRGPTSLDVRNGSLT